MEINYPRERAGKTGAVGVKRVQETRQAMAARRAEMKGCAPDEEATGGSQKNTESQDSGEGEAVSVFRRRMLVDRRHQKVRDNRPENRRERGCITQEEVDHSPKDDICDANQNFFPAIKHLIVARPEERKEQGKRHDKYCRQ